MNTVTSLKVQDAKSQGISVFPVPENAPKLSQSGVYKYFVGLFKGEADDHYPYHNIQGELLGYILRWNAVEQKISNGNGKDNGNINNGNFKKEIRPFIYGEFLDGKRKWCSQGFPIPRPLFNLDKLTMNFENTVLICEGEKTAQAAELLFPMFVTTTTMQGAQSAKKTEYSPLKGRLVIIAMDHDEAGLKYGKDVYEQCQIVGTGSVRFLNNNIFSHYTIQGLIKDQAETVIKRDQPVVLQKGYDLADALMEGWTSTLLLEFEQHAEMPLFIDYTHVLSKAIHRDSEGGCDTEETVAGKDTDTDVAACIEADDDADTESFKHLATLSAIQYDRIRKVEAKRLSISLLTLDNEVSKYRPQHADATNEEPSDTNIFPIIEPWTHPVAAEELLQELSSTFKRFAILPEHADTVLALWVIFTWLIDSVGVSPILAISSPEKRCGKTTVISILGNLVCKPLLASNISAAALFRTIELWKPTIIIDEADTFIRDSDELRGIINSGHTRPTAYVIRTTGEDHTPKRFSTWGAKAIAIIGSLPDTLHDRSIVIQLRRKLIHEKTEKLRHADLSIFGDLQRKLLRFATDHMQSIAHSRTSFPENIRISDRALDNWEPLLAIAKFAGPAWTEKVYQAASNLTEDDKETLPIGAELLKDIEILFEYKSLIKIHTTDLINYLCEDEESPWSSYNFRGQDKRITPRQLSRLLTPYQIHTKNIEIGGIQRKGFEKTQLEEIWKRYNTNIISEAP